MTLGKTRKVILSSGAAAVLLAMALVVAPLFAQHNAEAKITGNALALHNIEAGKQLTATATVGGLAGSVLKLSSASVPIDIPLERGYENGNAFFFIATDASDKNLAAMVTNLTGFKVNYSPLLAKTPQDTRGQAYIFENGVKGNGPLGFQPVVVNAKPGDAGYSPLHQINFVKWTNQNAARELKSVGEIMEHKNMGHLTVTQTNMIANHPAIKWNGGSLKIRADKDSINADSPYVGGQSLNIDTKNMIVTMVAHRGWGPDGRTIYYIVTDATPEMPANMMGVSFVKKDEKLAGSPAAVDLFQFMNGINGSGPMGFQAGIGGANPDDSAKYSPMWRISFIEWKDPSQARVLENLGDINAMVSSESVTITPALGGKHVVNCPFFTQDTVFEHASSIKGEMTAAVTAGA
jgi:hypothetical protein